MRSRASSSITGRQSVLFGGISRFQGLDLGQELGDEVVVDLPTHVDALHGDAALAGEREGVGGNLRGGILDVGIPLDDDGGRVSELERHLLSCSSLADLPADRRSRKLLHSHRSSSTRTSPISLGSHHASAIPGSPPPLGSAGGAQNRVLPRGLADDGTPRQRRAILWARFHREVERRRRDDPTAAHGVATLPRLPATRHGASPLRFGPTATSERRTVPLRLARAAFMAFPPPAISVRAILMLVRARHASGSQLSERPGSARASRAGVIDGGRSFHAGRGILATNISGEGRSDRAIPCLDPSPPTRSYSRSASLPCPMILRSSGARDPQRGGGRARPIGPGSPRSACSRLRHDRRRVSESVRAARSTIDHYLSGASKGRCATGAEAGWPADDVDA